MSDPAIKALILTCTLSPSPKDSSSELIAQQVADKLATHGVQSETFRLVDFNVKPGVLKDMGPGDDWPMFRDKLLASDILVLASPIWVGHPSSVAQRVLERLDAELAETDDQGRPILFDKVGMVAVVGNEDGAHHVIAELSQGFFRSWFHHCRPRIHLLGGRGHAHHRLSGLRANPRSHRQRHRYCYPERCTSGQTIACSALPGRIIPCYRAAG